MKREKKPLPVVPDEIVYATVTVTGDRSFSVSNYRGIIEYSDTRMRINTPNFVVSITGENFEINYVSDEDLTAKGTIKSIEFVY